MDPPPLKMRLPHWLASLALLSHSSSLKVYDLTDEEATLLAKCGERRSWPAGFGTEARNATKTIPQNALLGLLPD